jgi:hypothetical protein
MSLVKIPYEYFNGEDITNCGTCSKELIIDVTDYPLCGEKYFTLRLVDISGGVSTFEYNGDRYGVTSITATALVTLINTAFVCPNDYGCNGQVASFQWDLAALSGNRHRSLTIVNDVELVQPNLIYSITVLDINGTSYGGLPYVVWDDTGAGGNASTHVADYVDAIIAYIESLSIPEYIGAINHARNGMSDNNNGTNMLDLFFVTTTTVDIQIDEPTEPINGSFVTGGLVETYALELTLQDTSDISVGDILLQTNYTLSDGVQELVNSTTPTSIISPYNIFCGGCGLTPERGWIATEVICTEEVCIKDNVATAVIPVADILDCIATQTPKSGTSII